MLGDKGLSYFSTLYSVGQNGARKKVKFSLFLTTFPVYANFPKRMGIPALLERSDFLYAAGGARTSRMASVCNRRMQIVRGFFRASLKSDKRVDR